MPVENLTRIYRRANDPGLSGSEAITVEVGVDLDQTISASTEEEVTQAFWADRVQTISMLCDQAVEVQALETRYAILDLNVVGPDTITYTGDISDRFFDGDLVRIEGTVADDGIYQVEGVAFGAGTTTITMADGNIWPTGAGGAVGTFSRIATQQRMGYHYDIATATAATGIITIAGDVSDIFAVGDKCIIDDSTGNDGIWEITVVTTDGPPVTTTSITLIEYNDTATATILDNTNDGNVIKVRSGIELTADVPFLWSYDSGIQNPFIQNFPDFALGVNFQYNANRGSIVALMVDNTGTATSAAFDGLIGTNSVIF
jgi:hypothetical protein